MEFLCVVEVHCFTWLVVAVEDYPTCKFIILPKEIRRFVVDNRNYKLMFVQNDGVAIILKSKFRY